MHHSAKEPEAPSDLRATNSGSTEVTLEWAKPKVTTQGGPRYTVSPFRLFCIFVKTLKEFLEEQVDILYLFIPMSLER